MPRRGRAGRRHALGSAAPQAATSSASTDSRTANRPRRWSHARTPPSAMTVRWVLDVVTDSLLLLACHGLDRGATGSAARPHVRRSSGSDRRGRTSGRTRPGAVGVERDAFDEERRRRRGAGPARRASRVRSRTGSRASRARTTCVAVARRQELVQRAVLEVAREEAGEPLGRQVDLLEQVAARRWRAGAARGTASASRSRGRAPRRPDRWPTRAGPRSAVSRGPGRAACISSVKLARPAMSRSMRGWRTNVPRPRVRSMRPSRASSPSARRMVIRLQP